MQLILNNNQEEIPGNLITVTELLKFKNFTFKMLVTKINGVLVQKSAYESTIIRDGDIVNVLHLISGG